MREIVETAEVVRKDGHVYLLARVSSATLDSLAAFETERADLEDDGSDEPSIGSYGVGGVDVELDTSDDEPDRDDEYDFPRERQQYIVDRQVDALATLAGRVEP